MFDLLFANKKINSFQQLKENFDLESVKLYFLGGSLAKWLDECGETEIAERIRAIDIGGDIDIQLTNVFGQPAPIKVDIIKAQAVNNVKNALSSFLSSDNFRDYAVAAGDSSFELNTISSFSAGSSFVNEGSSFEYKTNSFSYSSGSFKYKYETGSFQNTIGSFKNSLGSYRYEYEHEYESGSFRNMTGSFNISTSSFGKSTGSYEYEYAYEYENGSFRNKFGSFSSSSFKNFASSFSAGSFAINDSTADNSNNYEDIDKEKPLIEEEPIKTPEEKISENFNYSYLNRFGYGIHLI